MVRLSEGTISICPPTVSDSATVATQEESIRTQLVVQSVCVWLGWLEAVLCAMCVPICVVEQYLSMSNKSKNNTKVM